MPQLEKLETATLIAVKSVDPQDFRRKRSGYELLKNLKPEDSQYEQAIDKYTVLSQCRVFSEDLSEQIKIDDQDRLHSVKMYEAHISVGSLDEAEMFQAAKHFLIKMHHSTNAAHLEASFYPQPKTSDSPNPVRLMYLAYTPDTSQLAFRDTIWDGWYARGEDWLGWSSKVPGYTTINGSEMITVQAMERCN